MRYRTQDGSQKRLTLGGYPEIPLAKARQLTAKFHAQLVDGIDPVEEKKRSKIAAVSERLRTIEGLAEQYFEDARKGRHKPNGRPKREQTLKLEQYYYDRILQPAFGSMPLARLERGEFQSFVNQTADDLAVSAARQCRNIIRQLYSYGIFMGLVETNPAMLIQVAQSEPRERVITDRELRSIWNVLDFVDEHKGLHLSPEMALALKLAAITLQRGGEIAGLHSSELSFNEKIWIIPGARTKNRRAHVVPLSKAALETIEAAIVQRGNELASYDGYIFPSPVGNGHITRHAMTRAMKRVTRAAGVVDATVHDLRRTGATNLTSEEIGIERFIVSRVLNHLSDAGNSSAATAVYDRNEYLPQKRKALEKWADKLARIVTGRIDQGVVLPFPL